MLLSDDGTKEHRDTQITSQFGCLPGRCVVPQPEAGTRNIINGPRGTGGGARRGHHYQNYEGGGCRLIADVSVQNLQQPEVSFRKMLTSRSLVEN